MRSLLSKIGISETDFEYILRAEESLGTQVKALSEAFFFQRLDRMEALAQVAALATEEFHKYVLNLLFWLHTIPLMSVEYEKRGIPEEILVEYEDTCIRIPMLPDIRSLNLSNSVAIVFYEALRQQGFESMQTEGKLHHLHWKE